ncbi:MAG: hypothetical protein NTU53_16625 [Planctomycetota bacterium]|nr:hypothetical protein [Planctomycetota bacterium]
MMTMIRAPLLALLLSCMAWAAEPRIDLTDWPLKIGQEGQLFVDDFLVARKTGVEFRLRQPEKLSDNPIVVPTAPSETLVLAYGSVLRNGESRGFRMWYTNNLGIAYAQSPDGLRWSKPPVGMMIDGKPTNLLMRGHRGRSDTLTVSLNPDGSDAAKKYLAYVFEYRFPDQEGVRERLREGLYLRTSPDGVRWMERPEPVMHSVWRSKADRPDGPYDDLGDVNYVCWDPKLRKFMGHIKITLDGVRTRGLVESDDGIHFSNPRLILRADDLDRPGDQLYSLVAFPYESVWLGFLGVYHKASDERMDIQLAVSHDGRNWRRSLRQPFLSNGPEGSWDWGVLHMAANPPLRVGEKLYIYYGGCGSAHNVKASEVRKMGIGLATLRPEGFVSVDAGAQSGTVVTRPLCFQGRRLSVNATVRPGGSIRVAVLGRQYTPIERFGLNDSVEVVGDGLRIPVGWRATDELPPTDADRHVRLQFELKDASVYSFRIE